MIGNVKLRLINKYPKYYIMFNCKIKVNNLRLASYHIQTPRTILYDRINCTLIYELNE